MLNTNHCTASTSELCREQAGGIAMSVHSLQQAVCLGGEAPWYAWYRFWSGLETKVGKVGWQGKH